MKLTIFSVSMADYGMYKCVAKNPRGETDGTIRLYGKYGTFYFRIVFSDFEFELRKTLPKKNLQQVKF